MYNLNYYHDRFITKIRSLWVSMFTATHNTPFCGNLLLGNQCRSRYIRNNRQGTGTITKQSQDVCKHESPWWTSRRISNCRQFLILLLKSHCTITSRPSPSDVNVRVSVLKTWKSLGDKSGLRAGCLNTSIRKALCPELGGWTRWRHYPVTRLYPSPFGPQNSVTIEFHWCKVLKHPAYSPD
jgi:hypothetical protein